MRTQQSFNNCSDIWQLKIMASIVKRQDVTPNDNVSLLSMEILNSLLLRCKKTMSTRMHERKFLMRKFLFESNLNFLQDFCLTSLQELIQLVVYFDLPLGLLAEPLSLENANLLQFMFEIKNRHSNLNSEFILNLWKMLKD